MLGAVVRTVLNWFWIFSVYEVYVKEENAGSEGKNDVTVVSSLSSTNDHQLIQVIIEWYFVNHNY